MSIVIASIVAAIGGIALRNIIGYLQTPDTGKFEIKKSLASAIIGFLVGIPLVVTAFEAVFGQADSIPETVQLSIFAIQIAAIAGIDSLTKGGFKAASKNK